MRLRLRQISESFETGFGTLERRQHYLSKLATPSSVNACITSYKKLEIIHDNNHHGFGSVFQKTLASNHHEMTLDHSNFTRKSRVKASDPGLSCKNYTFGALLCNHIHFISRRIFAQIPPQPLSRQTFAALAQLSFGQVRGLGKNFRPF